MLLSKQDIENLIYAVNGTLKCEFESPLTPYGEDIFNELKSRLEKTENTAKDEHHWIFQWCYNWNELLASMWPNNRFTADVTARR